MNNIVFKIYIPFEFVVNNDLRKLTINEFHIQDVHIKLHFDSNKTPENCYILASTKVEENDYFRMINTTEIKIGKLIQSFFDGLSYALSNAAFFNIFNHDDFAVKYEIHYKGDISIIPYTDENKGLLLYDELVIKAINYANSNDEYIKRAFCYMKEGEYFSSIGRYNNSLIQFAVALEYLINYQLKINDLLDSNGNYCDKLYEECKKTFYETYRENVKIPFAYLKYEFGLNKLGFKMDKELIATVDLVYKLRNKLAHGYNLYEAFDMLDIKYNYEKIDELNIYDYMIHIVSNLTEIFNFFKGNFSKNN